MTNIKFTNNSKKLTTLEVNNNTKDITLKLPTTEGTLITKEESDKTYVAKGDSDVVTEEKLTNNYYNKTETDGKYETKTNVSNSINAAKTELNRSINTAKSELSNTINTKNTEVNNRIKSTEDNLKNNYRKMLPTITTNTIKVGKSETYKTVQEVINAIQANDVKLTVPKYREINILLTSDVTETESVYIQSIPFYIKIYGTSKTINWTLYSPAESNWYGSGCSIYASSVVIHTLTVTCKNQHFCFIAASGSDVRVYDIIFNLTNTGLVNCAGPGSGFFISDYDGSRGYPTEVNITLDNTLKHLRYVLFIDTGGPTNITHHCGVVYNLTNTSTLRLIFFRGRAGCSLNAIGSIRVLDSTIKIKGDLNQLYQVDNGTTVSFNGDFSEVRKSRDFIVANIPLGVWNNTGCFIASGNPTAV